MPDDQLDYDGDGTGNACEKPIIVFLPGFMGSRLWRERPLDEDKIWLNDPNDLCKVNDLGVYTKPYFEESEANSGIIKVAAELKLNDLPLLGKDVYGNFLDKLKVWDATGLIKSWVAFPYSWDKSVIDIARYGTQTKIGNTVYTENITERIAVLGRTAPLILIGHSNGGLLAKAVVAELQRERNGSLVRHLVLVGSPQVGTPKAISALLHGELGQRGYDGVFLREAGEGSIGANTLLPSRKYSEVDDMASKLIVLDIGEGDATAELLASWRNYGVQSGSISTIFGGNHDSDFLPFLTAAAGDRQEGIFPGDNCENALLRVENQIPNVLDASVVGTAMQIHDYLDYWVAPDETEVVEIVGQGIPTTQGIRYYSKELCEGGACNTVLLHENISTMDGDGTVVAWSGTASSDASEYYLDLEAENNSDSCGLGDTSLCNDTNVEHANITSSQGFQRIIKSLILGRTVQESVVVSREPHNKASTWLYLRVESPVELHVYDNERRHTGPIESMNTSIEVNLVENEIPNSYIELVDGHYNISVAVGREYDIELIGLDIGTFSLIVEEKTEDGTVDQVEFLDIPVTSESKGTVRIESDISVSEMGLDLDGDGSIDFQIGSAELTTTDSLLRIFFESLRSRNLPTGIIKSIESKINSTAELLVLNEKDRAFEELGALLNFLRAQSGKKIEAEVATELMDTVLTLQLRIKNGIGSV